MPITRRNLIHTEAEAFKPPVFEPNAGPKQRAVNWLRRFLDLQAGSAWHDLGQELGQVRGRLLDIGCGAQIYRGLVPPGVTYRGIDTAAAKAKFGYEVPDTHYFEGDDWGIEPGSVDTALCTEVLEHIEQPAPFLAQTFGVLAPGGRLILTVPFSARWHFIPYDYWRYTPASLNMLLREAGFTAIAVHARGNPLTVACYKVMSLHFLLLFGAGSGAGHVIGRIAGILLLPVLALVALIANLTLRADWGDDCIGYTVTATRPAQEPAYEPTPGLRPPEAA